MLAEITSAGRAVVPQGREAIEAVAARYLAHQIGSDESSVLAAALARIAGSSALQGTQATDPGRSASTGGSGEVS